MIVVDTNVVAALYLETPKTAAAERILERDADWLVPPLWRSELRNVLALTVQHGHLDLEESIRLITDVEEWLEPSELPVPSDRVLRLASQSGCAAYDCEFVVLAELLDVPLVTLDGKLLAAFPKRAIALDDFAGGDPTRNDLQ